ncbi:hypothetical protein [Scleromatobacter humisilvae]|uniref:Uncharacterized protein n=1 Tax=Scleromatobacter humisilvae TaxID=2897159 RepID=A0A9X1YLX5_9BURK|nr:hypothetical protein [Scleromatobacter humisilvae]MCK9687310.1 hypothetical protein [Scleromatobacter humisilvae]
MYYNTHTFIQSTKPDTMQQNNSGQGIGRSRAEYKTGERSEKVKRLSTRAPTLVAAYINQVAATASYGYRSKVQMLSILMHRFLEDRPWDKELHGKHAFPWHGSRAKSEGIIDFHIELQPVVVNGRTVSGATARTKVEKVATAEGVSGATFALTFLWWVTTVVHPAKEADLAAALKALPRPEVDARFKGFGAQAD